MSAVPPAEVVDELTDEYQVPLNIPDLDRSFRLKIRAMVALGLPLMYEQFSRDINVTGLRREGYGSVVTYAGFERAGGPLPVAAPLTVRVRTRHCELSGWGLDQRPSRLGFESRFTFLANPGLGDPLRYREVAPGEPVVCGRGRVLLTLIRPFGPPGRRIVPAPLAELSRLTVHVLRPAHPSLAELTEPPPGYADATPGTADRTGVFGLQHTDTNQYVYTGVYLALLEDELTNLLAGAGLPAAEYSVDRVAALFKNPFRAGDRYAVRGKLWQAAGTTRGHLGVYPADAVDGARVAVFGCLDGAPA